MSTRRSKTSVYLGSWEIRCKRRQREQGLIRLEESKYFQSYTGKDLEAPDAAEENLAGCKGK